MRELSEAALLLQKQREEDSNNNNNNIINNNISNNFDRGVKRPCDALEEGCETEGPKAKKPKKLVTFAF